MPSLVPTFSLDLPRLSLAGANVDDGGDGTARGNIDGPGYFDVLYLDEDCLIISQNAPGGIFVNVRDDSQSVESFFPTNA